jgi:outer membrane protein OmpA-like peptidoglycan-associated protein
MTSNRNFLFLIILTFVLTLTSCTPNPFRSDNELTGTMTGTAVGAGVGAGGAALAGASKIEMGIAGILGGALGYYVTSLPFKAGGVTHVGGQVYTLGDYVTINIPSDVLFDVNSSDFLPGAGAVLDSAIAVLNRHPGNNIMISGNTSGFYTDKFERKISEARARQIAAYFWANGVNNFNNQDSNYAGREDSPTYSRKLSYVGYGSYFPISNDITAQGVRENSRIQITSYPSQAKLHLNKCGKIFTNIGATDETPVKDPDAIIDPGSSFASDNLPENTPQRGDDFKNSNQIYAEPPASLKGEAWTDSNSISSSAQTRTGGSAAKQGGFTGKRFKDD